MSEALISILAIVGGVIVLGGLLGLADRKTLRLDGCSSRSRSSSLTMRR